VNNNQPPAAGLLQRVWIETGQRFAKPNFYLGLANNFYFLVSIKQL